MANIFTLGDQQYKTGDTVRVHLNVTEGDKTRIQVFEGLIIKIRGEGASKSFTVRKIGANAVGVERILPVMCPTIAQIEKRAEGNVRRAKLYYLRDRVGRRALKVKPKLVQTQAAASSKAEKSKPKSATVSADAAKKEAKPKTSTKKTASQAAKGKTGRTASKKAAAK